jgi:hypothetical protein
MHVTWLMPVAIAIPLAFAGGFIFGHDNAVEAMAPVLAKATRQLKEDVKQFEQDSKTIDDENVIIKNLLKRNKACKPLL